MTNKAVELMRSARDKIFQDTDGMSWSEEQAYLKSHRGWFEAQIKEMPSNSATSNRVAAGQLSSAGQSARGRMR
jgi:hypothetical protein